MKKVFCAFDTEAPVNFRASQAKELLVNKIKTNTIK